MTRDEHLYSIAAEEGCEVGQRCTKALRFGGEEVQPGQHMNNRLRILREFADLVAVLRLLGFNLRDLSSLEPWIAEKTAKVEHFLKYSEACGTLSLSASLAPTPGDSHE